jgi:hypothetical protein
MKTLKKVFNGIMIAGALAIGAGLAAKLIMEKDTIPKIICYAGAVSAMSGTIGVTLTSEPENRNYDSDRQNYC